MAYNGYTGAAKKGSAKSNHATVVKYVAAELQKCNLGETESMETELKCDKRTESAHVSSATAKALTSFKNPYKTTEKAVIKKPTPWAL